MKHGPGWVVFEQHYHANRRELLSIPPARAKLDDVARFMQQRYVDRYASLEGRIAFKKSPKNYPVEPMIDRFYPIIHLGHDPFFVGIKAVQIITKGTTLEFLYKIATDVSDPFKPVYESRSQTLSVDG